MSSIFEFSAEDLLRGKTVTPAWYLMKIGSVGSGPSKDGGSINTTVEATIIRNADDGTEEFAGVPIAWNFNSKAKGFAIGFFEALGAAAEPGKRLDMEQAVGETIEVFVENDTYQGRTVNRVNHKYRQAKK